MSDSHPFIPESVAQAAAAERLKRRGRVVKHSLTNLPSSPDQERAEFDADRKLRTAIRICDVLKAEYGEDYWLLAGDVLVIAIHASVPDGMRSRALSGFTE